jgi:hypothetical protein
MFYGQPNYGEDTATDAKEIGFYLEPAAPLCTSGGIDPEVDVPQQGVELVQLVLDSAGYAALQTHLGTTVALEGTLFARYTGHHHAPLLLTVFRPLRVQAGP